MSPRIYTSLVLMIILVGAGFTQTSDKDSTADQKKTIRVGIAATMNRSNSQMLPTWERDQLVRELQRLRTDRKSTIVLFLWTRWSARMPALKRERRIASTSC